MSDVFPDGLSLSYGDAPYDIHLSAQSVGADILASVSGGTRAHIGAVALAEPADAAHPVTGEAKGETKGDGSCVLKTKGDGSCVLKTKGDGSCVLETKGDGSCVLSCDRAGAPRVSVLAAYGHKDAILAEMFARGLCEKYGVNASVAAGVHVDGATADEIDLMLENAEGLLAKLTGL